MKNINKNIIILITFMLLASMIIIKISMPSYAIEPLSQTCNNNITSIEEAYIIDDNRRAICSSTCRLSDAW